MKHEKGGNSTFGSLLFGRAGEFYDTHFFVIRAAGIVNAQDVFFDCICGISEASSLAVKQQVACIAHGAECLKSYPYVVIQCIHVVVKGLQRSDLQIILGRIIGRFGSQDADEGTEIIGDHHIGALGSGVFVVFWCLTWGRGRFALEVHAPDLVGAGPGGLLDVVRRLAQFEPVDDAGSQRVNFFEELSRKPTFWP